MSLDRRIVLKEVLRWYLKVVGQRIKMAREAKGLTQEDLAAMVELSPTHVSVIERGLKAAKLDTFCDSQRSGSFCRFTSDRCCGTFCNWCDE